MLVLRNEVSQSRRLYVMADDDQKEEKIVGEEKKPGMVVEETEDTETRSQGSAAEPEEPEENPQESGSVFGTRDFSSSSFGDSPSNKHSLLLRNKKRIILIVLVVLAGVGLIAGGIWVYNSKVKPAAVAPAPSPQAPSPSPTPKVEVDVSTYKTRVLNGSGTPGKAGAIKEMLEEEGFKEVATGNAKSFDYTATEVSVKASVPTEVFEKIKKILADNTVVQGDALDDDDEYDMTIIVGSTE